MIHGQLMYNNTRLVISSTDKQHTIISHVHQGMIQRLKQCLHSVKESQQYKRFQTDFPGIISKAMSKNLLRNVTNVRSMEKSKSYQVNITDPIKVKVMQQTGIDIFIDNFKNLVVCIDYFSKWLETKLPIKSKSASTIVQFLTEIKLTASKFLIIFKRSLISGQ